MAAASRWKCLFLSWFARPRGDRLLYRHIRRLRPRSIVELGLRDGRRAKRLIEMAQACSPDATVTYAGIDLFELRPAGEVRVSLKNAFRSLKNTAARLRLLPGDPFQVLTRWANELTGSDLIVISADQDAESLARAWFYVPRMLHPGSEVFIERLDAEGAISLQRLTMGEIEELAAPKTRRRAA